VSDIRVDSAVNAGHAADSRPRHRSLATFRRTKQAEEELQLRLSVRSGDVLRRRLEPSY